MSFSVDHELDFHQNYLKKELLEKVKEDPLVFEFIHSGVLDGIWYWDLVEPENEWMSPKFWTTFGYDPMAMKHRSAEWREIIFEEDLKVAMRSLDAHLHNANVPYDQILRFKHFDGSTVWVRCRGLALHDIDGKPVRMLGAQTDITPIMSKQQELVRHQLNKNQLQIKLDKVERELALEKMMREDQHHKFEKLQPKDESTGLWLPEQAVLEAEKLYAISQRTLLPFNLISLKLCNLEQIENNFGVHEVQNKFAEMTLISEQFDQHIILTRYENDLILGFQIGYTKEDFGALSDVINASLEASLWSIVKPKWQVQNLSRIPKVTTDNDSVGESFSRFFQEIFTELTKNIV